MKIAPHYWSAESICLRPAVLDMESVAAAIYRRTCRTDFSSPGFSVLNLGNRVDSVSLRQTMLEMAAKHESCAGKTLAYLSAGRFDQQQTTPPHLDGGPDECFLMLGYEPTSINSTLEIYDYSRCAFDHKLSPKEILAKYNPMFKPGYDILRPYCTRIPCFSKTEYQIICINNSSAPYSESQPAWQGVLHAARIPAPVESNRRVVNSTMIACVAADSPDAITGEALKHFLSTTTVNRRADNETFHDKHRC